MLPLLIVILLRAQDARLEQARQVNLERAQHLPDFVADEIAVRYTSRHVNPPQWRMVDTIESEIAVRDGTFARDHVRVDGKPWIKPNLPDGAGWSVQFGHELKALFDPACHNDFEYAGTEDVHGKAVRAYLFKTGADGCFGTFSIKRGIFSRRQVANPPRFGRFLIDEEGGNLMYFESEANEFPKGFRADPSKTINLWDYATINGSSYLLPSGFEVYTGFVQENLWHVVVEYKNHRHFESSTTITFK